jgi:hypothetical protein
MSEAQAAAAKNVYNDLEASNPNNDSVKAYAESKKADIDNIFGSQNDIRTKNQQVTQAINKANTALSYLNNPNAKGVGAKPSLLDLGLPFNLSLQKIFAGSNTNYNSFIKSVDQLNEVAKNLNIGTLDMSGVTNVNAANNMINQFTSTLISNLRQDIKNNNLGIPAPTANTTPIPKTPGSLNQTQTNNFQQGTYNQTPINNQNNQQNNSWANFTSGGVPTLKGINGLSPSPQ